MTDAYFPPPVICLLTDSASELTSSSLSNSAISFNHRLASPVPPSNWELIWRKRAVTWGRFQRVSSRRAVSRITATLGGQQLTAAQVHFKHDLWITVCRQIGLPADPFGQLDGPAVLHRLLLKLSN